MTNDQVIPQTSEERCQREENSVCSQYEFVLVDQHTLMCINAHTHINIVNIVNKGRDEFAKEFNIVAYDAETSVPEKKLTVAVLLSSRVAPEGQFEDEYIL